MTLIHIAFGDSAAGSLRQALHRLERDEEVLGLQDDLSFGPIDGSLVERFRWARDELGFGDNAHVEQRIAEFWDRVSTLRTEVTAWLSSRSVTEYCGLLALASRVDRAKLHIVDVADSSAFATLSDRKIVEQNLHGQAVPVSELERRQYISEWERLRRENGAFRILTDVGIRSVPITHYDELLLSCVTDDWQSLGRCIVNVLDEVRKPPYRQCTGDLVFCGRFMSLVESGLLEAKGEAGAWSYAGTSLRRR